MELEATYKEFTTASSVLPSESLITHAESLKGNSPTSQSIWNVKKACTNDGKLTVTGSV